MFTRSQVRLSPLKHLVAVLCLCAIIVGSFPGQASAWVLARTAGRPGSISNLTTYVGDLLLGNGATAFTLYGSNGPLVSRSPGSSGTQLLRARYIVEKWNGSSWVQLTSQGMYSGQISANQTYYRFPRLYIQPLQTQGFFRITWIFDWRTTAGVIIASTSVVSNLATDHVCVTQSRFCRSYAGYVEHR